MIFCLSAHDAVSSTNDLVKEALRRGEPEGLAVWARRQDGGYGRQGRAWASPPGGLYLSLLLRPEVPLAQLPTLSLVAGLAVREAIARSVAAEHDGRIQVKWPNDVVFAREGEGVAKLCGISLERIAGGICVGIGVNVLPPDDGDVATVSGKNRPCYLAELGFTGGVVDSVRDSVLAAFSQRYDRWCERGFAPFLEEYGAHALLTGKRVVVDDLAARVMASGMVEGVDEHGRLLVHDEDSRQVVALSSGEAHISAIETLF